MDDGSFISRGTDFSEQGLVSHPSFEIAQLLDGNTSLGCVSLDDLYTALMNDHVTDCAADYRRLRFSKSDIERMCQLMVQKGIINFDASTGEYHIALGFGAHYEYTAYDPRPYFV